MKKKLFFTTALSMGMLLSLNFANAGLSEFKEGITQEEMDRDTITKAVVLGKRTRGKDTGEVFEKKTKKFTEPTYDDLKSDKVSTLLRESNSSITHDLYLRIIAHESINSHIGDGKDFVSHLSNLKPEDDKGALLTVKLPGGEKEMDFDEASCLFSNTFEKWLDMSKEFQANGLVVPEGENEFLYGLKMEMKMDLLEEEFKAYREALMAYAEGAPDDAEESKTFITRMKAILEEENPEIEFLDVAALQAAEAGEDEAVKKVEAAKDDLRDVKKTGPKAAAAPKKDEQKKDVEASKGNALLDYKYRKSPEKLNLREIPENEFFYNKDNGLLSIHKKLEDFDPDQESAEAVFPTQFLVGFEDSKSIKVGLGFELKDFDFSWKFKKIEDIRILKDSPIEIFRSEEPVDEVRQKEIEKVFGYLGELNDFYELSIDGVTDKAKEAIRTLFSEDFQQKIGFEFEAEENDEGDSLWDLKFYQTEDEDSDDSDN